MEHKIIPSFEVKVDADSGVVEHIFAVFGNVDLVGDVLHPGSFAKTIAERGKKVRVLDQHNADSIMRAIGKPLEMREIPRTQLPPEVLDKYPEATGGVWAKTQFLMDTPEGKGAFVRIKEQAIDEWSFAYDPLDVDYSKREVDGEEVTVRNLRTIKLYEYGPVLWGANPGTATVSAKERKDEKPWDVFEIDGEFCVYRINEDGERTGSSLGCHDTEDEARQQVEALYAQEESGEDPDGETKTVSGAMNLPLAARDRSWSQSQAESRVREWADAEEEPNAQYRRAFFWYDGDNADNFTAYKLQFADIIDDSLTAIPRGLFAVTGALQGARGGVDIPDGDKASIRRKVSRYYARMRDEFDDDSIVPPWDKASHRPPEIKTVNLTQLVTEITHAFYSQYPDIHNEDNGTHIVYWVRQVWDEFVIIEQQGTAGNHLWQVDYTVMDDVVNFVMPQEWVEVEMTPTPKQSSPTTAPTAEGNRAADNQPGSKQAGPATPPTSKALELIEIEEAELSIIEIEVQNVHTNQRET